MHDAVTMVRVDSDPVQPFPPRFRALKRWTAVALIVLATLAGLRAWWGYEARRRRDAFVAAAHARGERILPADFVATRPLPDDQNAAVMFRAAAGAVKYTTAQEQWEQRFSRRPPLSQADAAMLGVIKWQNRAALEQVRRARGVAQVDWAVPIAWSSFGQLMPIVNTQRPVTEAILYAAMSEHHAGNDAEVVELLFDMDRHRSAVGRIGPCLVSAITSWGIDAVLAQTIFNLAPTMDIAGTRSPAASTRPATRQRLAALIAQLLDDTDARQIATDLWDGEATLALDMSATLAKQMDPASLEPLVRPMYVLDGMRATRIDYLRAAATQPNLPASEAAAHLVSGGRKSHLHEVATAMSALARPARVRVFESRYRALSDRRAAAIVLGMRLYALEHGGALPPTLESLVPAYLPAVPLDPMAKGEQAMRYVPTASPPMLYSVGQDATDNGGVTNASTRWNSIDAVYLITLPGVPERAPATAPATRPGS